MADVCKAVTARSKKKIFDEAARLREVLQLSPFAKVQMVPLLEHVLPEVLDDYLFEVVPDNLMKGVEGTTDISLPIIRLADRTYRRLLKSDPDARFTAAHELGHLVFHSGEHIQYARRSHYDPCSDPEWQADRFAEAFLMPTRGVLACTTVLEVMEKFSVPREAAQHRFWAVRDRRFKNKGSTSMKSSP